MLSSPTYPDYDGYEIYPTENATAVPQPLPSYTVLQQSIITAQNAQFRNFDAALACVQRRNQQPPANGSWPYVDGWNTTLSIIRCVHTSCCTIQCLNTTCILLDACKWVVALCHTPSAAPGQWILAVSAWLEYHVEHHQVCTHELLHGRLVVLLSPPVSA